MALRLTGNRRCSRRRSHPPAGAARPARCNSRLTAATSVPRWPSTAARLPTAPRRLPLGAIPLSLFTAVTATSAAVPHQVSAVGREHDPIVGLGRGPVGYRVARQPAARRSSQSLGLPRMTSPSDSLPCIIPRDIESPICVGLNSLQIEKDVCDACRLALRIFTVKRNPSRKGENCPLGRAERRTSPCGKLLFVARWLGRVQECLRASYSVATE